MSHIVDYLRHTTSRSSEDSGLEELCNMLDPEHKDVSIDLDTYHAVMREWIDDCRNNGYWITNMPFTSKILYCSFMYATFYLAMPFNFYGQVVSA